MEKILYRSEISPANEIQYTNSTGFPSAENHTEKQNLYCISLTLLDEKQSSGDCFFKELNNDFLRTSE